MPEVERKNHHKYTAKSKDARIWRVCCPGNGLSPSLGLGHAATGVSRHTLPGV